MYNIKLTRSVILNFYSLSEQQAWIWTAYYSCETEFEQLLRTENLNQANLSGQQTWTWRAYQNGKPEHRQIIRTLTQENFVSNKRKIITQPDI